MKYVVFSLDLGRCFTSWDDPALRLGFNSRAEAEAYLRSDCWLCNMCGEAVEKGADPTDTNCYELGIIWSERRLRRDLNGAWLRERIKKNRRVYDPDHKKPRRR